MTANVARRGMFQGAMTSVMDRMGLNQTSFASSLDVPQRTMAHWLNEGRTPSMDAMMFFCRVWPEDVVLEILQAQAGDRFVVQRVGHDDANPSNLKLRTLELTVKTAEFARETHYALADDRLDGCEAKRLIPLVQGLIFTLQGALAELSRVAFRSFFRRSA